MSYDLYFWRYADEGARAPGKDAVFVEHMNALVDGTPPAEIDALPKDEVGAAVTANLKAAGWKQDDIFWDKEGATIEVYLGDHHVSFSLRHKWSGDHANFLMNIMEDFGCPLFDPQVSERFRL